MSSRIFARAALVAALFVASAALADPTPADYDQALTLRDRWEYLTRDVAFPASWVKKSHDFVYRKTVEGGFAFVRENADTGQKHPAFDQAALAAVLGKATHEKYAALRLPFDSFEYSDDGKSIDFEIEHDHWSCTLTSPKCGIAKRKTRPKGFDVVRDLRVPADNTPKVSPDKHWEALVESDNLVIRPKGGGVETVLSHDGSKKNFYDPETIAWSPDSKKIAVYRVVPGFPRYVTRVLSSPTDQLQPEVRTQLYPKPGDKIDLEQPVLFNVAAKREIAIANTLLPNPYMLEHLAWRKDSKTFAFEFTQRGHQHAKIIEVNADTGVARAEISEDAKTFIFQDRGFWHDVKDGAGEAIWLSERDGWAHLYVYDGKTGQVKNKITSGD